MYYFDHNSERLGIAEEKKAVYLEFESLSKEKRLTHMVFTRRGGVSDPPFDFLNVGTNTGDDPGKVDSNLQVIQKKLNAKQLVLMEQVHGADVVLIKKSDNSTAMPVYQCDALITDIPSIALLVRQADCQGIILFDRKRNVLSVLHSGWRGSIMNIIGNTISKMVEEYKCDPCDIMAAVGPSLGPCCAEFTSYMEIFPACFQGYMKEQNYFDFWSVSVTQLKNAGIAERNIEVSGICTKCNQGLFYSYRGENLTGRFATAAMITD